LCKTDHYHEIKAPDTYLIFHQVNHILDIAYIAPKCTATFCGVDCRKAFSERFLQGVAESVLIRYVIKIYTYRFFPLQCYFCLPVKSANSMDTSILLRHLWMWEKIAY